MAKYIILYNPLSDNGMGEAHTKILSNILESNDLNLIDITKNCDIKKMIGESDPEDTFILSGGDGTLNRFFNDTDTMEIKNEILYYATGSGNDFLMSLGIAKGNLVPLNPFFGTLPTVTVNETDRKFINGVGFGFDGYCGEAADALRKKGDRHISTMGIAVKGLLFRFKPVNATITVDGRIERFKDVWLAPTMYGRFYNGGMLPVPDQDREDGTVSVMVLYHCNRGQALTVFPKLYRGEYIHDENIIRIMKGHNVTVEFDRPAALQIDGEIIKNITSYSVKL
ncbi:diacylglycerol kinase family protein [uncultured Ruminococcus sp.]|uniref:diacylglycerol/lipid kinase family protein n=1 Tax=uncultured Ruminococcus sp. TaxID=165186 RepID=UPI002930E7C0|nr:diacylglycerol kinase family protein [uncultured Ruminococcus sp.]